MEERLKKLKRELMKPDWTENLHLSLEKLPVADVKEIVESMTDNEIERKVNNRRHQEAYIADYIDFLWEISEDAYWRHVIITLDVDRGLLLGDDMEPMGKLFYNPIPDEVFKAVVDFALGCNAKNDMDFDVIGCVLKSQVENFNRLDDLKKHLSLLEASKQPDAEERIQKMLNCECNYNFYN